MLPPGHIAAGYLAAKYFLRTFYPGIPPVETNELLLLGAFFAFAPDLDAFFSFFVTGSFTFNVEKTDHRKYISHAPVIWLAAGLLLYFFGPTQSWRVGGLLLWLCSWSHFALDSVQSGIMWLWPFSREVFALKDRGVKLVKVQKRGFFAYWLDFVWQYFLKAKLSFFIELALIIWAAYELLPKVFPH